MTDKPNLYGFATKELAQDATIAYILAWADPLYKCSHPRLHALGTRLLRSLLTTDPKLKKIPYFGSVNVQTQVDRIDILVRINANQSDNRVILIIEDKVSTLEHSNQIERYICTAKTNYDGEYDHMVAVYLKTGNESRKKRPNKDKCGRFLRRDLLRVLDGYKDTKNVIVNDFRAHLQRWENETNAWECSHYDQWKCKWRAWEGFYSALEKRFSGWCGWGYVSNASGGFIGWWWGSEKIRSRDSHANLYIQIHNPTRIQKETLLTIRIGSGKSKRKISPSLMKMVFNALKLGCEEPSSGDFKVEKAGRFRGGSTAAVAKVIFGVDGPWFNADSCGIVDLDDTVERVFRVRELLRRVADDLTEKGALQ